jgi:hypothetical protein
MRRIVAAAALLVASFALLGTAASAGSQTRAYKGTLSLGISGWGRVNLSQGFAKRTTFICFVNYAESLPSCPGDKKSVNRRRVVLIESDPYSGFRFAGWRGACRGEKPRCVIDMARVHPNASGKRNPHVRAIFVPDGVGLTRGDPLPIGTTAIVNESASVRVNAVIPDPHVTDPPPAGDRYFAANLTVTYLAAAGVSYEGSYEAIGSSNTPYTIPPDRVRCPAGGGPVPDLPIGTFLTQGQSETGWLCWTIAASDESSLELLFGAEALLGTSPIPAHWFALR